MAKAKVAVTIEDRLLRRLDQEVNRGEFASRSEAVQHAVARLLEHRSRKGRLLAELEKLDPSEERAMAEEALLGDETWPEF